MPAEEVKRYIKSSNGRVGGGETYESSRVDKGLKFDD